jgi:hypothetical protein
MWRARPIFISSTFLDMQAERDHLRTHVFPALEERLRERRHFAVWVDLRVGVAAEAEADEGAREIQVLKVCLGEVKRCRPFLIVLLGDRYGWIPPPDRTEAMEAAAAGEGFTGSIGGRSLTHLEIDFGVLSNPEQVQRTLFYFREPLPYAQMPEEFAARYSDTYATDAAAAERARSLAALKQRIEVTLPARVRPYRAAWDSERRRVTGLDAFGQMVLEDVWAELADETETFEELEISWQQAERNALDDFAAGLAAMPAPGRTLGPLTERTQAAAAADTKSSNAQLGETNPTASSRTSNEGHAGRVAERTRGRPKLAQSGKTNPSAEEAPLVAASDESRVSSHRENGVARRTQAIPRSEWHVLQADGIRLPRLHPCKTNPSAQIRNCRGARHGRASTSPERALARDGPAAGGGDGFDIFGEHTCGVARLWWLPGLSSASNLLGWNVELEEMLLGIDGDRVPFLHERDEAALIGFRSNMPDDHPPGSAGKPAIG